MTKRLSAIFTAAALALSFAGCSSSKTDSPAFDNNDSSQSSSFIEGDFANNNVAEEISDDTNKEEGAVAHISPMEKISSNLGTQISIGKSISRVHEYNTIELPLSDYIQSGDLIHSFTFVIYGEGGNINQFKGGCGISVTRDCPATKNENWYQSPEFIAPTEGGYGEITWEVPENIANYINAGGTVKFGYYWGDCPSITLDSVICSYTRTKNVPVDGSASKEVNSTISFNDEDNFFRVPLDFIPENTVPETVTYHLSFEEPFGKFNGAFAYGSPLGSFKEDDTALISGGSDLTLTWFFPSDAKNIYTDKGELRLGYWWSESPTATLKSVDVKYSTADTTSKVENVVTLRDVEGADIPFRSAQEIMNSINIGWNLGNTLDSYKTAAKGLDTETSWGNPKASKELISTVKSAGFNTIRIPVTWGEHMDGNTIQTEWLDRVQEVVDYAYNMNMFVILDMHHDDYIWFRPSEADYEKCSEKLKSIWTQISERFKDYDDKLIFEGMNEPRTVGSALEWLGGSPDERAVINKYEADFVNAVRATGGNNNERTLIITSYAASAESNAIKDVQIPNSDNLIMAIHYYAPWRFAEGKETRFDDFGRSELEAKFAELKSRFIDNGIPVIIDEFGCVNVTDVSTRANYYQFYISAAKNNGIKCVVWDNGIISGSDSFGIMSRESFNWDTSVLTAIMDGAK